MSDEPEISFRVRQKQRRRARVAETALRLFSEHGYSSVTIAEVADEAEVSPRTVSTYFPTKEELVFPDRERWLGDLLRQMDARGPEESALEVVRRWVDDSLQEWAEQEDEVKARQRLIESEPRLQAYNHGIMAEMAELLRVEIARDLEVAPDDTVPRMAAAATIAVFDVVTEQFKDVPDLSLSESLEEISDRVGQAVRFVEAGIAAA